MPILQDRTAFTSAGPCTIRPIYVRKRCDRDTRRGDTLLFLKEYHFNLGSLIYTSSWLALGSETFSNIPTEGNVARVNRTDVIRYSNDYYIYENHRPKLQDEQSSLKGLHGQTVVVHNHLTYWTPVFRETWSFFPEHAPYVPSSQHQFRQDLWAAAKSGYLCDVVIQGEDFEFPAHCIVLRTVSYYKVMFASNLLEGLESQLRHYQPHEPKKRIESSRIGPQINVQVLHAPPWTSEAVLRGFLYYVYLRRVPLDIFVSDLFALELIQLADFYNCPELVRDVCRVIRVDDPAMTMEVAESIEQTEDAKLLMERAKLKCEGLTNGSNGYSR